ncbi:ADP-ribosylglycohydrolase family protein [Tundrisphaera sp. TA3]|uniref:ADP-ribosylglycohydrolase family protein n=1 Tax=Tundrisphaera sp. TA3 TaxID=3435775 RepID=UPI003EBCDBF8
MPGDPAPGRDRFEGCLLGLAIGDGLGAPYEGLPEDVIFAMGPADAIVADFPEPVIRYTDDTQMTIAVAEALVAREEIEEESLCAAFTAHYDPDRGYGPGARRILGAMRDGQDWRSVARDVFPGGSLGNGAAMRVAPIGLLFGDDLDRVAEQAERSARPTHLHPIGIDGARLMAVAVALASRGGPFDRKAFFRDLAPFAETEEFRWQLSVARRLRRSDGVGGFGNGLEAHRSVTTALAIFAASPDDYPAVVARAIGQGNDVDTLAAMAGALAGARLGLAGIPPVLVSKLEEGHQGRSHILSLAGRLHELRAGRPDSA